MPAFPKDFSQGLFLVGGATRVVRQYWRRIECDRDERDEGDKIIAGVVVPEHLQVLTVGL